MNSSSLLGRFWGEFRENTIAVVALAVVVLIIFLAMFAAAISPQDPYDLANLSLMEAAGRRVL